MKINWGTAIVIAFIAFISFILFFVIRMATENRANHDLVTKEYYKAELAYQQEIDAEKKAMEDGLQLKLKKTPDGLQIVFPETVEPKNVKGTVSLYRPSNKHLDFDLPISLSSTHLLIPDKRLLDGRWDIKVQWEYIGESYLHKESITY
ncbi:FixH family protein [Flavobacteriaceae bacterium TP-CH-4]|uniref:FixH family protein n=1 Tax=Pelagihabitans pacificus TaxID=2696054 RepID=A0A967E8P2_9FLAO|nr:FixH family protein [Pelagihabitans pacificus]NHF57751.1 FixH family protein [Pelagihabitans pacificus]